MKFGISLIRVHYRSAGAVAHRAEELGYDSVWAADHLIWPVSYAPNYPYNEEGIPPIPPDVPTLDCWSLLTTIAAATTTIRLGTAVYILPLRDPLVTARAAMTVDVLSNGRLLLGAGAGWLAEEFEYAGLDYHTRGKRMDECIEVLNRLWNDEEPSFSGQFIKFGPVKFQPKPVQRPRPPLLVGGESPAALRRAATLGDGWIGVPMELDRLTETVATLRRHRAAGPRRDEPFEITLMVDGAPEPHEVARYEQEGVTRLVVMPFARTREASEGLERFAENVMKQFA